MAQLQSLTVRGFKSIRALEAFELRPLNVLIGANGAGKSNLLSLFHMFAALAEQRLQLYVQEHGGSDALLFGTQKRTPQIDVEFSFPEIGYRVSLRPAGQRLIFATEETWSRLRGGLREGATRSVASAYEETHMPELNDEIYDSYVRPAMGRWRIFHFRDTNTESAMRQAQPVRDNLRLKADATNLAPFLRHLRERYPNEHRRIVDAVRLVAPFFGDFLYRPDPGERVELEWLESGDPDTVWGARQLSDGTLRFICLATLLLQPPQLQPDTILIDEPELGLHPYALEILAALFRQASDARQLIVSTQSADLVSELEPEDVVVVTRRDGASVFERLDAEDLGEWLKDYSLGELWKANVVGGNPAR